MRQGQVSLSLLLLTAAASAGAFTFWNSQNDVGPESLHPDRSIVYFVWDGSEQHTEAIQQTAQYKALVESGLFDYGMRLFNQSFEALASQQNELSADELRTLQAAKKYAMQLYERGVSFSITDGSAESLAPMATLVLHDAAEAIELVPQVLELMDLRDPPETRTLHGREVYVLQNPRSPAIELTWWAEGRHLVVAIGIQPAERTIALARGEAPNVTTHPLWQKCCAGEQPFEVAAAGWLQFSALTERFGQMPIPVPDLQRPVTVNELANITGLQNLKSIALQFGYRGQASMSRSMLDAPGERTGLLALLDQPLFTIDDLPPLPPDSQAFAATSLNAARSYDIWKNIALQVADLFMEDGADQVRQAEQMVPQMLGVDVRGDLLPSLGGIHCFYSDPAGAPFGMGFGFCSSVQDSQRLTAAVNILADRLMAMLQRADLPFRTQMQKTDVAGRTLFTLPLGGVAPTIGVGESWMSVGLYPQSVKAFFMRQDGQLDRWKPTAEHQTALNDLPKRFSTIAISDPRDGLGALYSLVPAFNSGIHSVVPALGPNAVRAVDLPPQEVVIDPLFPNVSVSVPTENGVEVIARESMPGIPAPSAQSAVVVPVLVALLLPAVQQAREAARRTHSQFNLKQLALAMHNYHDVYGHFPAGTEQDTNLPPEKRLSFFYALLPFVEQQALYQQIEDKRKAAWDSAVNEQSVSLTIPTLQNPGAGNVASATAHYAGVAGVGKDAPELPLGHERAGIFGYDRKTRIRDITDGTSNTMMITESTNTDVPWAAGGQTMISLTQEPYINGPDGMGGPYRGGCNVSFADGSVRFLSEFTDPEVVRALATMSGAEVVGPLP
ncbi:MAG: hypothetical protein Fues2KO_34020 [Fuerstiella sp.]